MNILCTFRISVSGYVTLYTSFIILSGINLVYGTGDHIYQSTLVCKKMEICSEQEDEESEKEEREKRKEEEERERAGRKMRERLVWFYGFINFVGYLMLNPLYIYVKYTYDL